MEQLNLEMPLAKVLVPVKRDFGFTRILGGPPESLTMRSGKVSLKPGESVGVHSTEGREELLVILEGEGEFIVTGTDPFSIKKGEFFYCPPYTEHNVRNVGSSILKYIYVVAKVL